MVVNPELDLRTMPRKMVFTNKKDALKPLFIEFYWMSIIYEDITTT